MPADELDLETGDPARADSSSERRKRRRERGAGSSGGTRSESAVETEIRNRLDRTFDRIAKAREARGDTELAEVINEDADAMAQGFLSLTHNIPFLRMPLIMLLNLLEPLLAFHRVGTILFHRWLTRRARKAAEREGYTVEEEQPEWATNGGGGEVPVQ